MSAAHQRQYAIVAIALIFVSVLAVRPRGSVTAQSRLAAQAATVVHLDGLRDRVSVRRDERGIPYIEAANEDDLYFAQGYTTASDRLWQMDLLRRTARGELSEIFGRVTLAEDKRRRLYGFANLSETLVTRLTAPIRAQFEAYARGVNAFIDSCDPDRLPEEFRFLKYRPERWRPADSLLLGKLMAEALSTSWQWDVMRASRADLPIERREALSASASDWDVVVVGSDREKGVKPLSGHSRTREPRVSDGQGGSATNNILSAVSSILETDARTLQRAGLYAAELAASNNWVVAGKRTASGKPLLANDPHLDPSAPSIWYLTHLSAPRLRVAGVTFPGVPGIIIGHNQDIAWGLTNLGADVEDVYAEKFDKDNQNRYWTATGWRDAEVRTETIRARKSIGDPSTETVPFAVTVTSHGPIILERDSTRYALKWTALDEQASELAAFYLIDRARNWKEFCDALREFPGPPQNFVYADAGGHIGYYGAGKIPIRNKGDGSLPYDGATGDGDWKGFIPFEALPHVYDPPNGIIVTANNRVVGRDYPYHITADWAPPYRARRILELLQAKDKLTADDFGLVQGDIYSISGAFLARRCVDIARAQPAVGGDDAWHETIELLDKWDGQMRASSQAAAILSELRASLRRRVLTAALGPARAEQASSDINNTFLDFLITEQPRQWLPKEFANYAELLRACDKDARESMTKRFGSDRSQWTWGRIAIARFPHPLSLVPATGDRFSVAPFPSNGSNGTFPTVNVGPSVSMRLIADTANWDGTRQGIALGESGVPGSPHWGDQLDDWKAVRPRVFPFTRHAVGTAAKVTMELAPRVH